MVQSHQFDEVVKFDYEIDDEDSVEVEWAPISSIKPLSAFKQLLEAVSESSPEPPGEFAEEELPTVPGHDNKAAPATATGRTKRTLPRAVTAPGGLRTADPPEGHMSDTASDTEAGADVDIPPVPEELVRYLLSADMNEERKSATRWKKVKVSNGFSSFWNYMHDDDDHVDPNDTRGDWLAVLADIGNSLKGRLLRRYTSLFQGHDKLHLTDGGIETRDGPEVNIDDDESADAELRAVAGAAAEMSGAAGNAMENHDPYTNPTQMRFPRRPAMHPSLSSFTSIALTITPANIVRDAESEDAPCRYDISSRAPTEWEEYDTRCLLRRRQLWQTPQAGERLSLAAAHHRKTSSPISIWVVGKPSSGKSTVAAWLATKLGLVNTIVNFICMSRTSNRKHCS